MGISGTQESSRHLYHLRIGKLNHKDKGFEDIQE